ncbi:MAG: carboxypeptidase regulatory-like domain-containing protein [Patescibacteria group bacterium]
MWKKLTALFLISVPLIGQITVSGTVEDELKKPIVGAVVIIEPDKLFSIAYSKNVITDSKGLFGIIIDSAPGSYLLSTEANGFHEIKKESVNLRTGLNNITIKLTSIPAFSVTVAPPQENQIILEKIELSQTINQKDITNIPVTKYGDIKSYVSSMAGVFSGPQGKLFFDGSPADQNNYLFEGLVNITDPISYDLKARINTYGINSFDRFSGRYSPEFGKGSGGTFVIYPESGDNKFRYGTTDFLPGVELNSKGLNLTSWQPRFFVSGPIIKDRFFFFKSIETYYNKNIVFELPENKDRTISYGLNGLMHIQANLTSNNIITSNFLLDTRQAPRIGLSPLKPPETTEDTRDRIYFWSAKNQYYKKNFGLETGYGLYKSFVRRIPQGQGILKMSPSGDTGFSPFDVFQSGSRHQLTISGHNSNLYFIGAHRLKVGLDIQHSSYFQDIKRTGFEHYRLNETLASRTVYFGSGKLSKTLTETAGYLMDEWSPKTWLFLKYGIRWDNDNIVSNDAITTRASLALIPPGLKKLKISAGFGTIPSSAYLKLFSRHLDQYSLTTAFDNTGLVATGPTLSLFTANHNLLKMPLSQNISTGLEVGITKNLKTEINYLRKRIKNGYVYAPNQETKIPEISNPPLHLATTIFNLLNYQTLSYDSVSLGFSKNIHKGSYVRGFYTWSRGISNSSLDINIDEPIIYTDTGGRLSWDVPHRFQILGFINLTPNNSISFITDWHKGQPFTTHDEDGRQIGAYNSLRFPSHFNINIGVERKLKLFKKHWGIRPGVENIMNRSNPTAVNANTGIPGFPIFYGIQPRKYVLRIRLLGNQ